MVILKPLPPSNKKVYSTISDSFVVHCKHFKIPATVKLAFESCDKKTQVTLIAGLATI